MTESVYETYKHKGINIWIKSPVVPNGSWISHECWNIVTACWGVSAGKPHRLGWVRRQTEQNSIFNVKELRGKWAQAGGVCPGCAHKGQGLGLPEAACPQSSFWMGNLIDLSSLHALKTKATGPFALLIPPWQRLSEESHEHSKRKRINAWICVSPVWKSD